MRDFPVATEATAARWRRTAISDDDWQVQRAVGIGESQAFFVRSGSLSGVGKPGRKETFGHEAYRAANEKIASDLAFDLELPVPPVTLWRRPDHPPHVGETLTCISAVPFEPLFQWGNVVRDTRLVGDLTKYLVPFASEMAAFDTWVDNRDRINEGNLLVHGDINSPGRYRAAYIDYSYSLAHSWKTAGEWSRPTAVRCYPEVAPDFDAMGRSISRIQLLEPDCIKETVRRIPDEFLPRALKTSVEEGLLYRQARLREYLTQKYPGLP